MRHCSTEEYQRYTGEALPAARLAAIWRGLPERERFGFVLSLTEDLADLVIELTAPVAQEENDQDANDLHGGADRLRTALPGD